MLLLLITLDSCRCLVLYFTLACFPTIFFYCVAHLHCSPDVSRTQYNPGLRPEHINECNQSRSSVTYLSPYGQQFLQTQLFQSGKFWDF